MSFLEWQSRFETGNEFIDLEHKQLFSLMNYCIRSSRNGAKKNELILQLQEIYKWLVNHFKNEEIAMADAGTLDLYQHRFMHNHLLDRIVSKISAFNDNSNDRVTAQAIIFDLHEWYENHLVSEDRMLFDMQRQSGRYTD